jgi:hypothetical protein
MPTSAAHAAQATGRPPALRLAGRIHTQLLAGRNNRPPGFIYALDNLDSRTAQLATVRHRWDLCQQHELYLAAAKVREELQELLRCLPADIEQVVRQMPPASDEHPVLPLAELVLELEHLEEEFGPWKYDKADNALFVTTESIALNDLQFGPFEIRLLLDHLGRPSRSGCYKVVALDPHPAASNDAVTHPHVSDEHLCEGEAMAPIQAALAEGRLADFFILVRCVLTTYNPSSPYVSLDDWEGIACHDCGHVTDDGSRYYCDDCNHDFCDDCVGICHCCDESRCQGCLEECPACQESVCSHCLKRCRDCGERCCESCLEEDQCPECRKAPAEPEPETPTGEAHETQSNIPVGGSPSRDTSVAAAVEPDAPGGPAASAPGTPEVRRPPVQRRPRPRPRGPQTPRRSRARQARRRSRSRPSTAAA